jgi:hypothetical protein
VRWAAEKVVEPKHGDIRWKDTFCLFPTKIGDTVYWLEFVRYAEVYCEAQCMGASSGWVPVAEVEQ